MMEGGWDWTHDHARTLLGCNFIMLGLFTVPKRDPSKKNGEGGDLESPRRVASPMGTMSMLLATTATMAPLLREGNGKQQQKQDKGNRDKDNKHNNSGKKFNNNKDDADN
jgi:hypothetical protein